MPPEGDTTATTTTTTTTPPAWHAGVAPEMLGAWQNKGLPVDDAKTFAGKLWEQYSQLEKHVGVPPDQLVRIPQANASPADIAAFHMKLGRPPEAKDYDLSGVKWGDGDLEPAFADAMRNSLFKANVPKGAAADLVKDVVKFFQDADAAEATINAGEIAKGVTELKKNWGNDYDFNLLKAMEGARRLGINAEGIKAFESQLGYPAVMEAMRKIGQGTSEDMWRSDARGPGGNPVTLEGARARLAELESDKSWGARFKAKDAQAVQEWTALTNQIAAAEAA